jgi:hypothetical protein
MERLFVFLNPGWLAASWLQALSSALSAASCPNCALGRAARADALADLLSGPAALAVLPFVFIAAVSIWAERLGGSAR